MSDHLPSPSVSCCTFTIFLWILLTLTWNYWFLESDDRFFGSEYELLLKDRLENFKEDVVINDEEVMTKAYAKNFEEVKSSLVNYFTEDTYKTLQSPLHGKREHIDLIKRLQPLMPCPSLRRIGGHSICGLDTFLRNSRKCNVMSFNLNQTKIDFELEVIRRSNCIVYLFDPFLEDQHKEEFAKIHPNLKYYDLTLGPSRDIIPLFEEFGLETRSVREYSIIDIMTVTELQWIDAIKFDYDGEECTKVVELIYTWKSFSEFSKIPTNRIPVGQLIFPVATSGYALRMYQAIVPLMKLGFGIYSLEPDLKTSHPWENVNFSLINILNRKTFRA